MLPISNIGTNKEEYNLSDNNSEDLDKKMNLVENIRLEKDSTNKRKAPTIRSIKSSSIKLARQRGSKLGYWPKAAIHAINPTQGRNIIDILSKLYPLNK